MPPKSKTKKKDDEPKATTLERAVLYDNLHSEICHGNDALTAESAMNLLGWEEQPEGVDWGTDFLLTDVNGKKIRCSNNARNRPFTESWAKTLAQEVLNKNFAPEGPNGEAIIIGKTGLIMSGQHRLIALVLAWQMWKGDQADHWRKVWPTEPVMETFINFGVSESTKTAITLDNVRPRTFADVLYMEGYFASSSPSDRKKACRIVDVCVKHLWERTRAGEDAYAGRRTHAEAMDFVDRHKSVIKSVKHVYEEEGGTGQGGRRLSKYLSLGYAAAFHYLATMSGTPEAKADKYRKAENPSETLLDDGLRDKADTFIVDLAGVGPDLKNLRAVFDVEASLNMRWGWLVKAWNLVVSGTAITPSQLKLATKDDKDTGLTTLLEFPTMGGIDFGRTEPDEDDEGEGQEAGSDKAESEVKEEPKPAKKKPTEEEKEAAKAKVKAAIKATTEKARATNGNDKPKPKSKAKDTEEVTETVE